MAYNSPGNLILLSTETASNSASLSFTTQFTNNFSTYYISIRDLIPATDATSIYVTVSTDNGSSYLNTTYLTENEDITSNANAIAGSTSTTQGTLAINLSNTSSRGFSGDYYLFGMNSSTYRINLTGFGCHYNSSGYYNFTQGVISQNTVSINAIKFSMSSGNITSGTIYLYGVSEP